MILAHPFRRESPPTSVPPQMGIYLGLCRSFSAETGPVSQSFLQMLIGVCWCLKPLPRLQAPDGLLSCNFLGEETFSSFPFLVHPCTLVLSQPVPHVVPDLRGTSSLHRAAAAGLRAEPVGADALAPEVQPLSLGPVGWEQLLIGPAQISECALLFTEREKGRVTATCPGLSAPFPEPAEACCTGQCLRYCTVTLFLR
uniref:Uncharacterized protein n=1 Tax=Theropithecus gelada TaxID=9565 RepID=A0A8D2G178_THEGE